MKKTIIAIMALCGVSQAMAAYVSSDDYNFSGSNSSIQLDEAALPSSGSFALSYELVGLTLNDIVVAGGTFFSMSLKDVNNKTESINVAYSMGLGFSILAGSSYSYSSDVPYIPESVPFLLQYDSDSSKLTFSYYMEYDSEVNPYDLTELVSVQLGANNIFERGIASGSFAISVPSGSVDNIYTWQGTVSASDMANPTPAPSVPEPTTATLSLLALAGLAARRRRK